MRRRTVLGGGMAGLMLGLTVPAWARGADEVGSAASHLAAARRLAGLPALSLQPVLTETARLQVRHMAAAGLNTHLDATGGDPVTRAGQAGYAARVLGEALAETFDGPAETVALWLAHEETRAVLLDPAARDLGLAVHEGRDGRLWWDLIVGA